MKRGGQAKASSADTVARGAGRPPGKAPATAGPKKGPWTAAEDAILREYVKKHGEGNWNAVQKNSGLNRCGKSCRLRWANHLRPNLKKGAFTPEEELLILQLHARLGNKWARMATHLPGRTDNEIKNYWNTRVKRRQRTGLPLYPPEMQRQFLLRHGYHLPPPATSSSASPDPPPPPPPPPPPALALPEPTTFPSLPPPTAALSSCPSAAIASIRLLPQNHFSNSLSFQFPLSSPVSPTPPAPPQQFPNSRPVSPVPLQWFSLSRPVTPTLQSPLFQPQLPQPLRYNLGTFDVSPPPSLTRTPYVGELPSSQMLGETGGGGGGFELLRLSSTGLLEDITRDMQRGGEVRRADPPSELVPSTGGQDGKWDSHLDGNDVSEGSSSLSPAQGSVLESLSMLDGSDSSINGIEMRSKVTNEIGPVHDDISMLFNMIPAPTLPATTVAPNWYNSDSGEISNGPSSVMTDDDMGLDMHQLASSYALAPMNQDWEISPCTWSDMSRIC